jgi:hypothetical protein
VGVEETPYPDASLGEKLEVPSGSVKHLYQRRVMKGRRQRGQSRRFQRVSKPNLLVCSQLDEAQAGAEGVERVRLHVHRQQTNATQGLGDASHVSRCVHVMGGLLKRAHQALHPSRFFPGHR